MNKFANKVARRPTCQFLSGLARVFEKSPVDEFQLVIGGPNHNKSWNAVDDQPKLYFALLQGLLGSFASVDVYYQVVPSNNAALFIPEGEAASVKPAIYPVGAPES